MQSKWEQIAERELQGAHEEAIELLEQRIAENADDAEAVTRLGLNLWYGLDDVDPGKARQWAERFMALFALFHRPLGADADFCWVFGKGMLLRHDRLPGATEALGRSLIQRACALNQVWERAETGTLKPEDMQHLDRRGLLHHVVAGDPTSSDGEGSGVAGEATACRLRRGRRRGSV